MEALTGLDINETFFVLTGDIAGYTKVATADRQNLMRSLSDLIRSWPETKDAQTLRGDGFQILFTDALAALMRSIQIRCWLKKKPISGETSLDARIAIGAGRFDFFGKDLLMSQGEAMRLSGSALASMKDEEFLKIVCPDPNRNEFFDIICMLMDAQIRQWTRGQAEVIFWVLEGKTQQQIAVELGVGQSAVSNKLKISYWKDFERTLGYIAGQLENMKGHTLTL